MTGFENEAASLPFSKRAARRLIQRAFVLVGRDRHIRQHLREVSLVALWVIEDWKFAWTVQLDRGRVRFERRPAKRPDLTVTWQTAAEFFRQITSPTAAGDAVETRGDPESLKFLEPVYRAFANVLRGVMQNPFDDEGNRLA